LVSSQHDNREYRIELATYCANLAPFLLDHGDRAASEARGSQALTLYRDLSRATPSLTVPLADAHSLYGAILHARSAVAAEREYSDALDVFTNAVTDPAVRRSPEYHQRYGDFLLNLSAMAARGADHSSLARAIAAYRSVAEGIVANGSGAEA